MTRTYIIIAISADRRGNDDDKMEEHLITTSVDENVGKEILKNLEPYRIIDCKLSEKIKKIIEEEEHDIDWNFRRDI